MVQFGSKRPDAEMMGRIDSRRLRQIEEMESRNGFNFNFLPLSISAISASYMKLIYFYLHSTICLEMVMERTWCFKPWLVLSTEWQLSLTLRFQLSPGNEK